MADNDVRVKEIRLLESYARTFKQFMESSIALTYRFYNTIQRKDDEAMKYTHRIADLCEIIRQQMEHAKNDFEASLRSNHNGVEVERKHREQAYLKYKDLYHKAKQYEESSKKLYQNIHAETERIMLITNRYRHKLENNKSTGENFLEKAISSLNNYRQQ